jgi:hypothetical protein
MTTVTTFIYHKEVQVAAAPHAHSPEAALVHYIDGARDFSHVHMVFDPRNRLACGRVFAEDVGRSWEAELDIDDAAQVVRFRAIRFALPCILWTPDMWDDVEHPKRRGTGAGYHADVVGMRSMYFGRDLAKFVRIMFGEGWTFAVTGEDKTPERSSMDEMFDMTHAPYDGLPEDGSVDYYDPFVRLYAVTSPSFA